MLTTSQLNNLRANQRFLALELISRRIDVQIFDLQNDILEARYAGKRELFVDIDSSIVPFSASVIASSKSLTKKLLTEKEISVPQGKHFPSSDLTSILEYVSSALKFPVVLKPSNGIQGENVFTGIENETELLYALQALNINLGDVEILIEEQFHAHEFRVFITRTGSYAVLHREPAYIIGDGRRSIAELAAAESSRRMNPRTNCLCEIVLDKEAGSYLKKKGLSFESIPAKEQKIQLRGSSNVKCGGVPTDVTDLVHPSVIRICQKALSAIPNLPYAGIDFMCADIRKEQSRQSYRILEVNSVPGIGMHMAPARGKSRNVAAMLVDLIFPDSVLKEENAKCAA